MIGIGIAMSAGGYAKPGYNERFEAMFELDSKRGLTLVGSDVHSWAPVRTLRSGASFDAGANKPVLASVSGVPVVRLSLIHI